ncbi:hypothetical protein [Neobacillus cucumis]|nr:hypothetical protein [Neobacillus cucumis]MBM7656478.1 hypothetical protein [Neobacillus cucumis]
MVKNPMMPKNEPIPARNEPTTHENKLMRDQNGLSPLNKYC